MIRLILVVTLAAFVAGCVTTNGRNAANAKYGIKRGSNLVNVDKGLKEANATCTGDLQIISELKDVFQSDTEKLKTALVGIMSGPQGSSASAQVLSTERRINRFDREVQLSFNSVNSSCRAFSRCMMNNYYDEGQCRSTLSNWERARTDFNNLTRELNEIEAETTRLVAALSRPVAGGKGKKKGPRLNRCECGSNVGPFANCCDVSSDQAYERKKKGG